MSATRYPSIYRARVVVQGGKTTAFVPQVFGDQAIVIDDTMGGIPESGMGWVFFQAGDPAFPVWTSGFGGNGGGGGGTGGGTGLGDEVFIGPTDPGMQYELWYDTDAASSSAVTPWTGVSFINGWVNFGGAEQTVQYRKVGDITYLRGVMKSGALGSPAFTLPVAFRPPANLGFLQEGASSAASSVVAVAVLASGDVTAQPAWGATGGYVRTNFSFSTSL